MYARHFSRTLSKGFRPSERKRCIVTTSQRRAKSSLVCVTTDPDTGIATIDLNRPPANALSSDLLRGVIEAVDECERGDTTTALLLTSSNKSIFCGGLELQEMVAKDEGQLFEFWTTLQDMWLRLYTTKLAVAAAACGHAPAGAIVLLSAADFRVMQRGFKLGLPEVKFGVPAPLFFPGAAVNCVGQRAAELAVLSGKMYSADEAADIGFVDALGDSREDTLTQCREVLLRLTRDTHPEARAATKAAMRAPTVARFKAEQESAARQFAKLVVEPRVQDMVKLYVEAISSKN